MKSTLIYIGLGSSIFAIVAAHPFHFGMSSPPVWTALTSPFYVGMVFTITYFVSYFVEIGAARDFPNWRGLRHPLALMVLASLALYALSFPRDPPTSWNYWHVYITSYLTVFGFPMLAAMGYATLRKLTALYRAT